LPISAVDTISLAFQHTKRQLIEPFRAGQWLRLAIVGLLAGELGSGGNFNFRGFNPSHQGGGGVPSWRDIVPKIDPAILVGLIAVIVVTGLVFAIVMVYISSVMRFILFDSVLAKECHIRANWNRRQDAGWKYFLWQLGLMLVTWATAIILIGVPVAFAFGMGWFKPARAHVLQLVLGGIIVGGSFVIFMIAVVLVHVLTKDFVVPQMALEGISAIEGWRRLWLMIQAEKSDYAIYIGMKIVVTIGASIVIGIVTLILSLVFAVPVIGIIVAAVIAGKTAGLTWNVFTITAAVVAGCILIAVFLFFTSLISVPAIVFFPAYSIYFFAPRYRPLSLALYPPPPLQPFAAPGSAPPEPPPFSPPPLPAM
jgi:hypothetical protein